MEDIVEDSVLDIDGADANNPLAVVDYIEELHASYRKTEFQILIETKVARKKLQLVGLVAMLLACKYEEVSVPVVDDLIVISDKAYTRKEILQMESEIEAAQWMRVEEYTAQPFVQNNDLLKQMVDKCLTKVDKKYSGFSAVPISSNSLEEKDYLFFNSEYQKKH